ncbi:MAG: ferritin-like domain-containing protein [Oceanococcaceae bacterium]
MNPRTGLLDRMLDGMPMKMQDKVTQTMEHMALVAEMHDPKIATSMAPSVYRGLWQKRHKKEPHVAMHSGHAVHFDLDYGSDFPEMYDLYRRAVANQWDGEWQLDWDTDVDPMDSSKPLLGTTPFVPHDMLRAAGIKLNTDERQKLEHHVASWMLSQFMHGEQGALYASAQVTESVQWIDGKLYGATQVMDEARHLEVFLRYLETKLQRVYKVNDNLFVIIDDLLTDSRWDIKFLGMQIMVEGLALGAFSTMYNQTHEPLLKNLLRYVIQDEARHVHYGVLALREEITTRLTPNERREREDWAFEIAMLMRNRFLMHEVYEEWFEGILPRRKWNAILLASPAMTKFRSIMFQRLVPNLKYIGLLSDRMQTYYDKAGLMVYADGKNASELTEEDLVRDNDAAANALQQTREQRMAERQAA